MNLVTGASFRKNDIQLLETGNFADGTVKCKDRTWKVHRALLASRLNFFKAAFYGSFAEATSGELDFPESDPDLVDIMLRHLYGEDLDVKDLKTPALCVRCWRLADYVHLESLKYVTASSLAQHLDAMALLANSSYWDGGPQPTPNWLTYLLEGLREVCHDDTTEPIQNMFTTFLWVTRFELLGLPETLDTLQLSQGVNRKLTKLLVFKELDDVDNRLNWIDIASWGPSIVWRGIIYHDRYGCCTECKSSIGSEELVFHNPFPVNTNDSKSEIGQLMWCKRCADKINEKRRWPWRSGRRMTGDKVKLEAWSWSDNEQTLEH